MRINFRKIIQLIKRYKYFVLFFIVLILFIVFNSSSVIEGLTGSSVGEYEFLAPPTSDNDANTVDDDTFKKFLTKMNETNCPNGKEGCGQYADVSNPDNIKSLKQLYSGENPHIFGGMKLLTKSEIEYYINNGYFPYGGYLVNYLTNQQSPMIKSQKGDTFADKIKTLQKGSPSRIIYSMYVKPEESKLSPTPKSYNIFMGTEKPPSSLNSAGSTLSSYTSATQSNSNYQDFVSLCKKVISQQ